MRSAGAEDATRRNPATERILFIAFAFPHRSESRPAGSEEGVSPEFTCERSTCKQKRRHTTRRRRHMRHTHVEPQGSRAPDMASTVSPVGSTYLRATRPRTTSEVTYRR